MTHDHFFLVSPSSNQLSFRPFFPRSSKEPWFSTYSNPQKDTVVKGDLSPYFTVIYFIGILLFYLFWGYFPWIYSFWVHTRDVIVSSVDTVVHASVGNCVNIDDLLFLEKDQPQGYNYPKKKQKKQHQTT